MTTLETTNVNEAVIIGTIERREQQRAHRNALGATISDVSIQLLTPFGEPFAIPLTIAGVAQHEYKLRNGTNRVAVEGRVRLERAFDRRYAHEQQARGRRTRTMQFIVRRVRDVAEGEQLGTSFVQLAGKVLRPPLFVEHPQFPDLDLALVQLGIVEERPSPFAGSVLVRREEYQVTVAVPVQHEQAGLLYRPGNEVRVQGELDCVRVEGLGRDDEEAVAVRRIRAEWEATEQTLKADTRERQQAYNRYLAQLRRFEDTPRWRVLAGYIEAVGDAQPLSKRQARTLRNNEQQSSRERAAVAMQPNDHKERSSEEGERLENDEASTAALVGVTDEDSS